MKKMALILVFIFSCTVAIGQSDNKKELVKKGDNYVVTVFHDNGAISQTGYYNLNGIADGVWTSYDQNGNKTAIAQYSNGKKVGTWYFYTGDNLQEVSYDNNRIAKVVTWKDSENQVVSKL